MDSRNSGFSSGIISGNQGNKIENWVSTDQVIWATEEDYEAWNREAAVDTNLKYDQRQSEARSGSSEPLNKRPRTQSEDVQSSNRSKAIRRIFFRTKLCCKFRAGTCPYATNCNFAHSVEELRVLPPNRQEYVARHGTERALSEPRVEFPTSALGSTVASKEIQLSSKRQHCRAFVSEEGGPYGDHCFFLHDEHSRARESCAITLVPGSCGEYGSGSSAGGGSPSTLKPAKWKTKICIHWKQKGCCAFGNSCHFAHGTAELRRYGCGLVEGEGREVASVPSVPHSDGLHMGISSQRVAPDAQRAGQRAIPKWKGPDKISLIYGDWIE